MPRNWADATAMLNHGGSMTGTDSLTDAQLFGDDDSDSGKRDDGASMPGQDNPRAYLGHFANENVTRDGHNSGMPKVKQQVSTPTAKRGFRKLPGTAANQQGRAQYGEADTGLRTAVQRRDDAKFAREMKKSIASIPAPIIHTCSGVSPRKKGKTR